MLGRVAASTLTLVLATTPLGGGAIASAAPDAGGSSVDGSAPTQDSPSEAEPGNGDAAPDEEDDAAGDSGDSGDSSDSSDAGSDEPEAPSTEDLNRQQAAQLFREGSMYYELGQYEDAIGKFETAWKLAPEPQLLFNLGQANRRWFEVDPEIDHLRKSRTFFTNYDQRMKSDESYSRQEAEYVANMIARLDAQIELEENRKAERDRVILNGPTTADMEAFEKRRIERERKLESARRLNGSGIGLIVVGSVVAGVGIGGVIARVAYRGILENSSGSPEEPSLATAEEDQRRRNGFLTAGQVGFGGLIAGGILLATGIGLRVAGGVIEKKTLATPEPKKPEAVPADRTEPPPPQVSLSPGGLSVRF